MTGPARKQEAGGCLGGDDNPEQRQLKGALTSSPREAKKDAAGRAKPGSEAEVRAE